MKRVLKEAFKKTLSKIFVLGQPIGIDILPRHFYSEIPNIAKLRNTEHWRKPYSMTGVLGADVDEQLQFVELTVTPNLREKMQQGRIYSEACQLNGAVGYGPIEADFLYAFIASHQPARITQIGCGVSTALCLAAAKDVGYRPKITCIDPFPTDYLRQVSQQKEITLIEKPIEVLDYSFLTELQAGDLFFVDSTHTLGPGGEVSRIILEMLTLLTVGTHIHFHDIWFPYDYDGGILKDILFFWHESVLLHAYLTNNNKIKISVSLSQLHYGKQTELARILPNYKPAKNDQGLIVVPGHYPCSIFLQVIA